MLWHHDIMSVLQLKARSALRASSTPWWRRVQRAAPPPGPGRAEAPPWPRPLPAPSLSLAGSWAPPPSLSPTTHRCPAPAPGRAPWGGTGPWPRRAAASSRAPEGGREEHRRGGGIEGCRLQKTDPKTISPLHSTSTPLPQHSSGLKHTKHTGDEDTSTNCCILSPSLKLESVPRVIFFPLMLRLCPTPSGSSMNSSLSSERTRKSLDSQLNT